MFAANLGGHCRFFLRAAVDPARPKNRIRIKAMRQKHHRISCPRQTGDVAPFDQADLIRRLGSDRNPQPLWMRMGLTSEKLLGVRNQIACDCLCLGRGWHPMKKFGPCGGQVRRFGNSGGAGRNRTADKGFADPCLTTWPPRLVSGDL